MLARRRAMTLDAGFALGCSQRGRGDKRRKGHTRHTSCHRRGPGARLEDGQKTACYMRTMAVIGDCWGRDRENGADICLDDAGRRTPAHQRRWGVRYWNTKRAMSGSCWGWDITAGKGRREKRQPFKLARTFISPRSQSLQRPGPESGNVTAKQQQTRPPRCGGSRRVTGRHSVPSRVIPSGWLGRCCIHGSPSGLLIP